MNKLAQTLGGCGKVRPGLSWRTEDPAEARRPGPQRLAHRHPCRAGPPQP